MVLVIDADTIRPNQIPALIRGRLQNARVWIAGTEGQQAEWHEQQQVLGQTAETRFISPLSANRGAPHTAVMLEIGRHIGAGAAPDEAWVLVGPRGAFAAAVEWLEREGGEATWLPSICEAEVARLLGGAEQELHDQIIRVFDDLAWNARRRGNIHVSTFGNALVQQLPVLATPQERRRLFGTKRIPAIAEAVGLVVTGVWVHRRPSTTPSLA